MNALAALPKRTVSAQIPSRLRFLFDLHRYKVAWGGRGGAKTRSFAAGLILLGANQPLRILCARETQKSLRESVRQTLVNVIRDLGLEDFYEPLETEIRARNGTEIIFTGLAQHTVSSIKSYEDIDICWVEEAQSVSRKSWQLLTPTIRAPKSEIWVSFNPEMESDETYQRFIVSPPADSVVTKILWSDNPWFPEVLQKERQDALDAVTRGTMLQEEYDNIWEGVPRTSVDGAIYPREVAKMYEEKRIRPLPYDPMLPVHTIWDLGWNDAMAIIMVQKPAPSTLNVINYMEDSFKRYDEYVSDLKALGYNWGRHWLPHDGENKNPQTGLSAKQALRKLGFHPVKIIKRSDEEAGIRAARMMFPRVYIDDTERGRPTGFLGAKRLLTCLRRYRRHIPKNTEEPATPVHDEFAHGAAAWRYLAQIVDQIRNDNEGPATARLPGFHNPDPGMGMLR